MPYPIEGMSKPMIEDMSRPTIEGHV